MGATCCKQDNVDYANEEVELSHFYPLRVIGVGNYGKVRIVQHKGTGRRFALKYISKDACIQLKMINNIISERKLLEEIDHPLVVNLRYAFQDEQHLFMVLDLMLGGDLRYLLHRRGPMKELQVRFYVANVALGLAHLHQQNIAHRDIKPDNILLDDKGYAHLSDFNIATSFGKETPCRWSMAGSLAYMAPEILSSKGYTMSVDWWSLGVVAYELLFGKRPFVASSNELLKGFIVQDALRFPDNVYSMVSAECLDVLAGLLTKSPFQRLGCGPQGFEKFKKHPWFRGLDWGSLERKEATPPFKPNNQLSNFDPVHDLEELLLEEPPLRPHKRPMLSKTNLNTAQPVTEDARWRQVMEDDFLLYDYTKGNEKRASCRKTLSKSKSQSDTQDSWRFNEMWGCFGQSKYRSQGYVLAPTTDDEDGDLHIASDK
ncbi:hypothetical protein DFQ28_011728 [Apophysomyces sp. BC1034]|nr:hypothetical protein DFQ29_007472 [Apophysomyces sp. BC1021]KAG0191480.1 hypothetical protein DFQ28_011728 [Apophysomyces sp. BC1034]